MGLLARVLSLLKGGRRQGGTGRARLGRRGEDAAADYLRRRGWRILARNWRTRGGEVDLVAFKDGVVAFVEVRSQTAPAEVDAALTVTARKQRRVAKAARCFCARRGLLDGPAAVRFDVVTVLFSADGSPCQVRHYEGAFEAQP